jgi:acyl carrier protein
MKKARPREEDVMITVSGFIREVIGQAWANDLVITMETSFNIDLELESIEFVALAEKLQNHYGGRVNFAEWLARMELDQIIGLKVGQLVEFIVKCQ